MKTFSPIAIVGIGGIFPDAPTLDAFWHNIEQGVSAARDVPEGRWPLPLQDIYDPQRGLIDHVYSKRGCYITDFRLDAAGLNIDPTLIPQLDPVFHLALHAARAAVQDANLTDAERHSAGVMLGNIALPTETMSAMTEEILGKAFENVILQTCEVSKTSQVLSSNPINRHAIGMVAGITAQAFGLGGGSFTVDGACAASLYALNFAVMELQAGRADAMLTGGVCRPDSAFTQMGFCQLGALSPTGNCSPFDAKNDGLVVGEGAGMFVLKRLDDAIRDKKTIYAVIRGIGLSNDRQGNLLAPDAEGQLRAMRAAYAQAGWQPQDVDLIECHATGTPVGDAVEFTSLRQLWGESGWNKNQCVIGGVKSNVGHLLTGAGAAGLMKTILALKHRVLPPTANFATPNPKLDLPNSPFSVLTRAKAWDVRNAGTPRRAAVSAFGFGGINAHVLLEEFNDVNSPPGRGKGWVAESGQHFNITNPPQPGGEITHPQPLPGGELIAVVGIETHIGAWQSAEAWLRHVLNLETEKTPAPKPEQWGIEQRDELRGYFLEKLELPVGKFKIPPKEMEESLPQQLLMLKVAAAAIEDAKLDLNDAATLRTGVFTGIGLDFNSTNFSYRWKIADRAKTWAQELGLHLTDNELNEWIANLRDAFCPPLTANRTVGALGGIVASRIAREFKIGGAGITISAEENSGLQALNAAIRSLQTGLIDQAIVGAVDMHGDIRSRLAAFAENPKLGIPAEGAVAVILKRLDDAKCDGNKIYAVIKDICVEPGDESPVSKAKDAEAPLSGLQPASALRPAIDGRSLYLGAATGLTNFATACLCLHHQLQPDDAETPQFWLRDRADGLRRISVNSGSADGNRIRIELEECDAPQPSRVQVVSRENDETLFAVEADDAPGIVSKIGELQAMLSANRSAALPLLARRWRESQTNSARLGLAAIAPDHDELRQQLEIATQTLRNGAGVMPPGSRLFFNANPLGKTGELAFVFPGSGSHYPGMGRDIAARWPDILRKQDADNAHLKSQYLPELFWNEPSQAEMDRFPREILLGQVAYSTMMADLLRSFGLRPQASIGYSLGESSALFALGVWKERDEMLRRIQTSPLYVRDLAGEFRAAAQMWGLLEDAAADWAIAAAQCPAEQVRAILKNRQRVYLLIINTPVSCVIGGERSAVNDALAELGCAFSFINGVSAAHCEVVQPVAQAYRAFHFFENATAPEGVRFYSTAWGKSYPVTPDSAADAILAQALDTIDFPAVIRQAHQDGVRVFVEVGPGNSCTNMIGKILENQPHAAASACAANAENLSTVLRLLGRLIAERVPVDLSPIYPLLGGARGGLSTEISMKKTIRIPMGGKAFDLTPYPSPNLGEGNKGSGLAAAKLSDTLKVSDSLDAISPPGRGKGWVADNDSVSIPENPPQPLPGGEFRETHPLPLQGGEILVQQIAELVADMSAAQRSKADAHEAYLKLSRGLTQSYEQQLAFQMSLIEAAMRGDVHVPEGQPRITRPFMAGETASGNATVEHIETTPVFMTREQCMEFAVGKIGKALGARFAEIDAHPTRVRLPDEPLMLVDRILEVEGDPCSMTHGRVVTEHDVLPGAWYLDCGRIPTCIAVESGQADLFLSGYLGIDFITKGLAVYRLLDATVTFHDDLPAAGAVIRHDIHIDEFFRQGETHLFRFRFESTVEGKLFLTMTKGCAGFFTLRDLEEGKGLVFTEMDLRRMPGNTPPDWQSLTKIAGVESYADAQLDALRRGDLAGCFGAEFAGLNLKNPCRLPGGRMKLVDRILSLDPTGGRFGLGQIRGEADIHPDDWFLTCHFSDDQVMPGTLMYECCLHTLRVLLMRMGWVGEQDEIGWQPVPGVGGQLKCRGQVIATTRKVVYEISLKEIGFRPEPYVICDAVMSADGKPIVRMIDMSLRLSGMTRETLQKIWEKRPHPQPAIFDSASIMAFSNGKPSEAFGERYRIFDAGRAIARLPGQPYQFLDRITAVSGAQWIMEAGKTAEAQYDTPQQEWYFDANRCDDMPFSVLLEIVLQPCGWLAAYVGSALTSDVDLSFRNLGGTATQFLPVTRHVGTLTTNVKLTSVSASGGMIIQHYSYRLTNAAGEILYDGTTYFGFFTKQALANQVGLREVTPYQPTAEEQARGESFDFPRNAPFPCDQLLMMDAVDLYVPDGGSRGLGFIRGVKTVNPDEWFFKAHFYQDPVWPGSLGLEAFLQLLKVAAVKRWGWRDGDRFETMVLNKPHEWVYRGQVIPTDRHVIVQAEITTLDDAQRFLEAEGFLIVDGRIIYEMKRFTLRIR